MRRDPASTWYVYVLVAYAIFATAGWLRSERRPTASSPLTAAEDDCECVPRFAPPARAIASNADDPPATPAPAIEASAGAAAEPTAHSAPADEIAAEVGRSLVDELYGSAASELEHPAELIASLVDLQSDRTQLPDDRLEAAAVLRRLQSAPPTAAVASELLELATARPDAQLALDVLEVTAGALEPSHAPALIALARSDSSAVRDATMLRLYELLRDPASRGALLPEIEGHSEPLDALARYVGSDG